MSYAKMFSARTARCRCYSERRQITSHVPSRSNTNHEPPQITGITNHAQSPVSKHDLSAMKQPLLLLSGLLCDETIWADIPERLAEIADVRIVSFRGYSSIGAMAAHALDGAPERFAVAGHSMGGRVALEIVRLAPDRVT